MHKAKEQIRKELLETLNNQDRKEAEEKSKVIKEKLFSLPEFKKAKFVMLYASKDEEVNTKEMIDEALGAGKRVALPLSASPERIVPKEITNRLTDLEKGTYGIYEPRKCQKDVQPENLDLIIIPGVAFDKKNRRLGRGKGYYDRFLKKLPKDRLSIGLAFDFQIVKSLPENSHDIPVSKVITN